MITVEGKYNTAKVMTDNVDEATINQLHVLCDQPFSEGSNIVVQADTHAGKGCVIGFTADMNDKICPNLVGVDISCGMHVVELGKVDIDLAAFDKIVHDKIPTGFDTHGKCWSPEMKARLKDLKCYHALNNKLRIKTAIGSLGGGNHFIELDKDDDGIVYLVIHSGSRNLGLQVANYYQKLAIQDCKGLSDFKEEREALIASLKQAGETSRIQSELEKFDVAHADAKCMVPEDLAYLEGDNLKDYLHDAAICSEYATLSRGVMAKLIMDAYGLTPVSTFETLHNYVDESGFVRKGAISAQYGEKVLIPMNMRDGAIIAYGLGNESYNCSAPHGAGRTSSRAQAKATLSMDEFRDTMKGVYSSCICEATLDESPMAYKPAEEILNNIKETVEVEKVIKPIYNFKDATDGKRR